MLDMTRSGPIVARLSCASALVVALGLGAGLSGCADIHPAPDDPDVGIMDAPDDEAVHEREGAERAAEHGQEEEDQQHR